MICEDTYDHLPTKKYMIRAILYIDEFSSIKHVFKFDDHVTNFDIDIINKIKSKIRKKIDYCGQNVHYLSNNNNKYHYNKCPKS